MKNWYESKVLWANFLALAGSVAVASGLDLGLTADVQAELLVGIMAAVNMVLRVVTTKPIV